ncbi:hypothetical protein V1511DRAFT_521244 [Dipodascopsis uninucleata]
MVPILVAGMLITGTANSLLTKFQDNQCVANCDGPEDQRERFEQPVIQTFQMFIGEASCWTLVLLQQILSRRYRVLSLPVDEPAAVHATAASANSTSNGVDIIVESDPNIAILASNNSVHSSASESDDLSDDNIRKLRGRKILGLSIPTFCDICATTLMNIGLFFTPVSIYQMTRGALVLFVGLASTVFLKRKLTVRQWAALGVVVLGVFIVGLSGTIYGQKDSTTRREDDPAHAMDNSEYGEGGSEDSPTTVLHVSFGVFLIALAQMFAAGQFVYEEYLLSKYHMDSMRVVGWEGIFGLALTAVIMLVSFITVGHTENGRGGYFDIPSGFSQMFRNKSVFSSSIFIMLSIGLFNFFGIAVTRTVSATSRSTIDTCRTLFIWIISIIIGWEKFRALQLFGFVLMVYGTLVFNEIISPYIWHKFDTGRIRLEE